MTRPATIIAIAATLGLLAIIAGTALHASAKPAHACSCIPPRPPLDALARADAVFAGDVVSISEPKGLFRSWLASSTDPITVEFRVSAVWKGEIYETMFLETAWSSASCGFEFLLGEKYLVYAREGWVSLCSRTKSIDKASEDLMALGEGSAPALNDKREESLLLTRIGLGVAVIGLAGVAIAFALWRRQQSRR